MLKLFYGSHEDQFGHLYRPADEIDRPVLIVIHGDSKDDHTPGSYATKVIVEKFKTSGAAIWDLEYRRMNAYGDNTKAPWPAVFEDIGAGIDYLRTIAKTQHLDLDRILVAGPSAGGNFAAWAASRKSTSHSNDLRCEDPLIPTRIVSIAGLLGEDGQESSDWPRLADLIAAELEQLGAHRPVDPELLPVIEVRPSSMGPLSKQNIEAARRLSDEAREMSPDPAPDIHGVRYLIEEEHGHTDLYVYQREGPNQRHALLWFHGGGYVMGSGDDFLGKQLASDVGCTVVSVDYRLAPEHPFPAGVDDGVSALRWLFENASLLGIDADKIGIGGASAGAGMAAGVALSCRDSMLTMPIFQLLMYPMLDNLHDTTSGRVAEYPIWNRATSLNAWEMYLGKDTDVGASPYASPSRASELSGLPPTYLCVGDVDLFRDENIAFMQKLIADGSPGEFDVYPGVYHAAENQYPDAVVSKRMYADTLGKLKKGLLID
jgi:acetyl esterase/lipase